MLVNVQKAGVHRSTPTTGTGNIICPAPPAGFVRVTNIGGEGGVGALNLTGGAVNWNMLIGAQLFGSLVGHNDTEFNLAAFGTFFLTPGNAMLMDFISGGGGAGMEFAIAFQDIPASKLTVVNAFIGDTLTTIVPQAPAGKAHVLYAVAGVPALYFFNQDSSPHDLDIYVGGDQVEPTITMAAESAEESLVVSRQGFGSTPSLALQAQASAAGFVRVLTAYYTVDLAA